MNFNEIPTTLDVSLYGTMEKVSDVLSKCRVRIFYKGMNRNRTYISDDFAEQLISSLAYVPVKGIFDKDSVDYTDHGENNSDGRIYGIVPENSNFAWEEHLDEDGITRTYACSDVLLFTGLYPEAKLIPSESQSMEIFRGNLKGEWRISELDNQPYYYFIKGCLVGLQVLGSEVEPCFEGAAFFNLTDSNEIKKIIDYIQNAEEKSKQEGIEVMEKTLFRISDNEKMQKIEILANPNFNEEGGWIQERVIFDVYDDYALSFNCKKQTYERVYYTKDGDNVSLGDIVEVKIVDVTTNEYSALEAMKAIGGYEAVNAEYTSIKEKNSSLETENCELQKQIADFENAKTNFEDKIKELTTQNSEKDTTITNYSSENEALKAEKTELNKKISDITNENESLIAFQKKVEKEKKEAILTEYEEYLPESTIVRFQSEMDNYSIVDFKKEVCTAVVESEPALFHNKKNNTEVFYKGGILEQNEGKSGVIESPVVKLLNNYKNGGSK